MDPLEIEALARFHRGRASLVATFPANLFHGGGGGVKGTDVHRAIPLS